MTTRRIVGCMTGTSLDGLDAALVEVDGSGLGMTARVLRAHSVSLDPIGSDLRALASQAPMTAGVIAALSRNLALRHAEAVRDLLAGESADLICVHGQTVFHSPPVSWQVFNGPVLAHEARTPVVYDLRAADLAAGGQGAPITPIADWILLRDRCASPAIVNLGGFANFSAWSGKAEDGPAQVRAGDVCACNQVLDSLARARLGCEFDAGGEAAMSGRADPAAQRKLADLLSLQSAAGRSLGTGDEAILWGDRHAGLAGPDLLRTACEAIGSTIATQVAGYDQVVLAGGGVRNVALVGAIRAACSSPVVESDHFGIAASYREAICFAVLGALCQDRVPITLPGVTGVPDPAPISGVWVVP
ncbi:MAG: anhydro-N-acetylmuramic acid kinase [Phycisphaeraceae bacterium]|nr:anhydro-N-acetylmuramic acid kinase [Phycisphaeraceae bacterium]